MNNKRFNTDTFDWTVIILVSVEPIANIPQIIKVFTTKSAEDFFMWTWMFGVIANFAWIAYGLKTKKFPVLLSGIIWLVIHSLMTIGVLLYG